MEPLSIADIRKARKILQENGPQSLQGDYFVAYVHPSRSREEVIDTLMQLAELEEEKEKPPAEVE